MANENETIIDSENNEEEVEETDKTEEPTESTEKEEKPKETPEAKKARLERQLKQVNKQLGIEEKVEEKPVADKSDELNEGQIALLTVKGYDHSEDIDFIQKEMQESRKTLAEVLTMTYVKEGLKELKEARGVKDATPEGGKRSQASAKDSVTYWIAKGELPPNTPENMELRRKIVNQREKTDQVGSKFSETPLIQ